MHIALPGLQGFDDDRAVRRREERARRRPRRMVAGVALLAAGPLLALWYAWDDVALGRGAFDTASTGTLRGLPFATIVVAAIAIASVVVGGRLAIERDGRVSRAWVDGLLIVAVLGLVTCGATALLPMKLTREDQLDQAIRRELPSRLWQPGTPDCAPAIDPGAYRPWIQDAEVCGYSNAGVFTEVSVWEQQDHPGDDRRFGFVYSPDHEPRPEAVCLRQIDEHWAEVATVVDATCPSGLGYTGAG